MFGTEMMIFEARIHTTTFQTFGWTRSFVATHFVIMRITKMRFAVRFTFASIGMMARAVWCAELG